MRMLALAAVVAVFGTGAAQAQERRPSDEAVPEQAYEPEDDVAEDEQPQPRRKIRVLEDPYQIASFYRSRQGSDGLFAYDPRADRYPIAGFYRNRQSSSYGPGFWGVGYRDRERPGLVVGFRRSIGEHGDLFLFVPFLSPLGPLSGILR